MLLDVFVSVVFLNENDLWIFDIKNSLRYKFLGMSSLKFFIKDCLP